MYFWVVSKQTGAVAYELRQSPRHRPSRNSAKSACQDPHPPANMYHSLREQSPSDLRIKDFVRELLVCTTLVAVYPSLILIREIT